MKKVYGLVLAALFGMGVLAHAESQPPVFHGKLTVSDKAGAFSDAGVKKAQEEFNGATFKAKTSWHIVTTKDIPSSRKADFDAARAKKGAEQSAALHEFFSSWAKEMGRDRSDSITTLVYYTEKNYYVQTHTDKAADIHRHFTDTDAKLMNDKLRSGFKKALEEKKTGTASHADHDAALSNATDYVINHLKDTTVPHATGKNHSDSPTGEKKMSIGGWICIGLVAVLLIWLVIGVIRALTGGGGGGGGYGGGGYGGGGGGFMTGLMGGMFGAMAGMWMYNQFMGGNHASDYGSSGDGGGGDTGATDTGEGDYGSGAEDGGGGGDWGDSGGGDTGGGGDWGGGGDGGGGDFGGGGDW